MRHAARSSAHFAPLLAGSGLEPGDAFAALARLPVLRRAELQADPGLFCATTEAHGPHYALTTSGSSGQPVALRCTGAALALRQAFTLRNFAWQRLEPGKTYASIKSGLGAASGAGPQRAANWNAALGSLFGSGPSWSLPINEPLDHQLEVLRRYPAHYLMSYPSNLRGLLELSPGNPGPLEVVVSCGESLPPSLAAELAASWGVRVVEEYSSEELGPVAAQCERGSFHLMAEGLLVEVLRDDGAPAAPGERGRVVATDLRNFATALLRYDTADYAIAGEPCACGRGLPTLGAVVGRERYLACLPDGRRFWPSLAPLQAEAVRALVRQFQLLQEGPRAARLRVRPWRALAAADEALLAHAVRDILGEGFAVALELVDGPLRGGPNGKFMEFRCLWTPGPG